MKVFLGGTTADSKWRDIIMPMLDNAGVEYFNPVVDDWRKEHQEEEIRQRKSCDFVLYVITPLMRGLLSIAEIVDDSNKRPDTTIFCFLPADTADGKRIIWTEEMVRSNQVITKIASENGATCCSDLEDVVKHLKANK